MFIIFLYQLHINTIYVDFNHIYIFYFNTNLVMMNICLYEMTKHNLRHYNTKSKTLYTNIDNQR